MTETDIMLFCNTLNTEAGRFLYSDPHLHDILLKAEEIIMNMFEEGKNV